MRSNGLCQVKLKNAACGDASGAIHLRTGINSFIAGGGDAVVVDLDTAVYQHGLEGRTISVPAVCLDDDLQPEGPISLIKIDAEGFEYQILEGAGRIVEAFAPLLFIELHPQQIEAYGHSIAEVCDLLRPHYDMEFWDYGRFERLRNPAARIFGRYFHRGYRFPNEAAMLEAAHGPSKPSQLFLLGHPKHLSVRE